MYFTFKQPISNILVSDFNSLALAVSLNDIKQHLRIDFSQDDAYLTNIIKTATKRFEDITGLDLITKQYKTFLDKFPICSEPIKIKRAKLQSIISIQYYLNNVLTTFDSSNYYFNESNFYSSIYLFDGKYYPQTIDKRANCVIINFTSGFGANDTLMPISHKQAIMEYVAFMYKNRGDSCCNDMNIAHGFFDSNIIECFI